MPANAKEVFLAVAERPAAERAAYIDGACGDDDGLRRRVEALLRAHDDPDDCAGTGTYENNNVPGLVEPELGSVIGGRYKLREKLGEGGMGVVYAADQIDPVQRRVALKFIRANLPVDKLLARFEQERQALALMDHPNIAKIYEAGISPPLAPGRIVGPYFVMELIKGQPITRYCDDNRLTPRQRLELFIPVCQAVQHAHQKGIIHRDLKPSNIIIGLYDGRPVPKVIDFGVAKMTGPRLTQHSVYTEVGSVIGTLEYMSPEQAEYDNLDIDTRSDIYALGVILYELLTGTVPLSRREMQLAGLAEQLRLIKEHEPAKPSTKLSQSGSLPSVAACRHTEPARLTRLVRGELDWITMKALEKDRARRYDTANGFAMDILRYLNDEPVLAGPPSTAYRVRKFVARHQGAVIAAGLLVLALVGGVIGTSVGLVQADRARRQAMRRLDQIEKGNDILASIFTDFDARKAGQEEPLQAVLGRRLEGAAKQIEGEAIGEPLVVAKLQDVLGQSLTGLGHFQAAIALLSTALATRQSQLGTEHRDTMTTQCNLAIAYVSDGQLEKALPLCEANLRDRERILGADHPDTLSSRSNLADVYRQLAQYERALPLLMATLKGREAVHGVDHPETLTSRNNLAATYQAAGKLDLALPLYEQTLRDRERTLGPLHSDTLFSRANLANAYREAGQIQKSIDQLRATLQARENKSGTDHPDTLTSRNNLAAAYHSFGQRATALPLFEQTYRDRIRVLGTDHPDTLMSQANLASAYGDAGRGDEALPLLEDNLARREKKLGVNHPDTLTTRNNLAVTYLGLGRLNDALPLFEQTVTCRETTLGVDHPETLYSRNNLGMVYAFAGQYDKAIPILQATLNARVAKLTADHPDTLSSRSNLGAILKEAGKPAEAIPHLETAKDGFRRALPPDHSLALGNLAHLAASYLGVERFTDAEAASREVLAMREKTTPDDWTTFYSRTLLGAALAGQGKYAEAETWLLPGYEGLKQRQLKIRPTDRNKRLSESLKWMILLYERTAKPVEAMRWRTELQALDPVGPVTKPGSKE